MSDEVPVVGAVDESAATNEAPAVDDTVHLSNEERLRILKLDDGTEAQKADHLEAVRVELAKRRRRELTQNTTEELRTQVKRNANLIATQERQLHVLRQETTVVARINTSMEYFVTKRLALAIAHCEKRVEMHKGATHEASDEVDAELERERQLLRALRQQCSQMCSSTHEHLATMRKATTDLEAELRDKRTALLLDENCLRMETAASPIRHQMLSQLSHSATAASSASTVPAPGGAGGSAQEEGTAMTSASASLGWASDAKPAIVSKEAWQSQIKESSLRVKNLLDKSASIRFRQNQLQQRCYKNASAAAAEVGAAIARRMNERRLMCDNAKLQLITANKAIAQMEQDRKVRSVHDEAQLMNSILHLRESLRSQRPAKEFVSDAVMTAMQQEDELVSGSGKPKGKSWQEVLWEKNMSIISSKREQLSAKLKVLLNDFDIICKIQAVTETIPDELLAETRKADTSAATGAPLGHTAGSGLKPSPRQPSPKKRLILPSLMSPGRALPIAIGAGGKDAAAAGEEAKDTKKKSGSKSARSFGMPAPLLDAQQREQLLALAYSTMVPRPTKYIGPGADMLVDASGKRVNVAHNASRKKSPPRAPAAPKQPPAETRSPRLKKQQEAGAELAAAEVAAAGDVTVAEAAASEVFGDVANR